MTNKNEGMHSTPTAKKLWCSLKDIQGLRSSRMFTSESKEVKISPKWTELEYYNDSPGLCKHLCVTKIPRYVSI